MASVVGQAESVSFSDADVARIVDWVRHHSFERVALQFPDALLVSSPQVCSRLQKELPSCLVFILGDSSYGGGGVDEVGAQHYGADCIVRFGQADQLRGGDLPVLFVFGSQPYSSSGEQAAATLVATAVQQHFGSEDSRAEAPGKSLDISLLLLCDLPCQDMADPLASALEGALTALPDWQLLVSRPRLEARAGDDTPALWHDWRWGELAIASGWWSSLGPLTAAAAARPAPLRVCGRDIYVCRTKDGARSNGSSLTGPLPLRCAIIYVGPVGSALERRLLLRYGASRPVWRLAPSEKGSSFAGMQPERLDSHSLLMKRYRYVELARTASSIGLLLVAAGGPTAQGRKLAQRLEALLRAAGRRSYRLVVGQPSQEKLGNFGGIDCYVLLAGPDQFPWDARDLMVPICTPYELEVALGAREWTGEYLTDLEEILQSALVTEILEAQPVKDEVMAVHMLGAGSIKQFSNISPGERVAADLRSQASESGRSRPPPATITPGLHGVPWKYSQEEALN
eukprot:TRINITY_DN78961_c0_g1_i1.p1 TRINITY_DN78961_c0_g1~~TRINITY_DN78961_c0_g1_i1.p1  ORF type:complete len:521 (+),score=114.33 TRINITY_DN78961_c0_g1_i1:26-1564(+)